MHIWHTIYSLLYCQLAYTTTCEPNRVTLKPMKQYEHEVVHIRETASIGTNTIATVEERFAQISE